MFEFRGAREAEREFAERGSASGVSRGQRAYEAAMAANEADRIANTLAAQQTISNIQQTTADMAMRDAQRQEIARQQEIELAAVAAEEARRNQVIEELRAREAAMGGAPNLGFGFGYMPSTLAELDRQINAARGEGFMMPGEGGAAGFAAYQGMLNEAARRAQRNIDTAPSGFFGAPTRFMNERFLEGLGSRIGGRDSEAYQLYLSDPNLTSPVYDTTGRLTGYRDQYGRLTGRDPIADAEEQERRRLEEGGEPEITGTVTDPATGQEKCPDGYIFDEDLQACRKKPMERAAVDTTPGERYIRSGLLDVAPEGLMGFQERYGAGFGSPMDFAAANREFRMGGAVTPSFYSAPPKLDGYTLLT